MSLRTRSLIAVAVAFAVANAASAQSPSTAPAPQGAAGEAAKAAAAAPAPSLRLSEVSLDVMVAAGASTERDSVLKDLQGGGHDPKRRGFTLQQAELAVGGAVDPYFTGDARIATQIDQAGGSQIELEEAYLTSTSLPEDLQLKAGHYLTEFGRINSTHAHVWFFVDQPIVNSRIFGGDGMRAPGARMRWQPKHDKSLEFYAGVQNANGEQMPSYLASDEVYDERPIGGRFHTEREVRSWNEMLWSARVAGEHTVADCTQLDLGASIAFGPNATGGNANTVVYGADIVLRHKRPAEMTPQGAVLSDFWELQGEVIARNFKAADQVDENDPTLPGDDVAVPGATLKDYGFYVQGLCGWQNGWAVGLRGEWVSGSGDSYDQQNDVFGRAFDAYRADRVRISPLIVYQTSPWSRLRLQYNYDDADNVQDSVHSVWLGWSMMVGVHRGSN